MFGISLLLVVALVVLAGWQVAFAAFGLSLLGTEAVDLVQQSDVRLFGR